MLFREQLGRNATVPFGQVARAARRQWFPAAQAGDGAPFADDLATLFCSKLVAVSYKSIGVLHAGRDASSFLPKHFAERQAGFLDLQGGAALGPETAVTFEPELFRSAVDALVHPFAATLDLVAVAATGAAAHPRPTPELYAKVLGPLGPPIADGLDHLFGASVQRDAATRIQNAARRMLSQKEAERRRLVLASTSMNGGGAAALEGLDTPVARTKGSERRARLEAMSATKAPRADGLLLDEHGQAHQHCAAASEPWGSPRGA
jgi:hypothetical protein